MENFEQGWDEGVFEDVEDVRPEGGGEEVVGFVWTVGAADVCVELHDAADAGTSVVSPSAIWVLFMLQLRL